MFQEKPQARLPEVFLCVFQESFIYVLYFLKVQNKIEEKHTNWLV